VTGASFCYALDMRRIFFLFCLFVLACQTTNTPFPGANLFIDPGERYHMFFISPPWEKATEDIVRPGFPEDPEREDFVVLSQAAIGSPIPGGIPLTGVSVYPPRPLGSLESALAGRRNELAEGLIFSEPINEKEFITDAGLLGREFSFFESLDTELIVFHRDFFFVMPDGFVMRLFYASNRSLDLPEIDFITKTLAPGLPGTF
jgi:hypothetical protein